MTFIQAIENAWEEKNSLLCVGLDPDIGKIPVILRTETNPLFQFNKAIIDATADFVCAFKPQIAYYSAVGAEKDLELTIEHIHESYPSIPVILDAKRGDIGSTAEKYATEVFDRYNADAVTISPYMGFDTLEPFLDHNDKGVVIVCRTSNSGANDIQDLITNGKKLYQVVAEKAATMWNRNNNILLVVGATYPGELKEVRAIAGNIPFLVPGIGAQGGDIEAAVTNGKTTQGTGMIINASRAILYASLGHDFAETARETARMLRNEINRHR